MTKLKRIIGNNDYMIIGDFSQPEARYAKAEVDPAAAANWTPELWGMAWEKLERIYRTEDTQ